MAPLRIALVTEDRFPDGTPDDGRLRDALARMGVEASFRMTRASP